MSELRVTINTYKHRNTFSIDGKPVSEYSELSNFIAKPFLEWAGVFYETAEREMNDDYSLVVSCEDFEYELLMLLKREHTDCKSIKRLTFSFPSSLRKRFETCNKLALKYDIDIQKFINNVPVYMTDKVYQDNLSYISLVDKFNAAISVVTDEKVDITNFNNAKFIIVPKESENLVYLNHCFLWQCEKANASRVLLSICEYITQIQFIREISERLLEEKTMEESEEKLLQLVTSIYPLISVDRVGKIESGIITEVNVHVYPESCACPEIRMESSDYSILSSEANSVMGLTSGQAVLYFFVNDEIIPFNKQVVDVFEDQQVKEIILHRQEPQMGIGKIQQIGIELKPDYPERLPLAVWYTDNPGVATVDNGVVTAKTEGRVKVFVKLDKATESVIIDILPNISKDSFVRKEGFTEKRRINANWCRDGAIRLF